MSGQGHDSINDTPAFARTPGRDIFGKLDDKLPEIRINGQVRLDAERRAHEDGLDLTAWLRELVCCELYGSAHMGSLYEERAARVHRNARQEATVELRVVDMPQKDAA